MLTSTISPTGGVTVMVRPANFFDIFCKSNLANVIANVYYFMTMILLPAKVKPYTDINAMNKGVEKNT